MSLRPSALLTAICLAAALAGCGAATVYRVQQREEQYQAAVARIDARYGRPSASTRVSEQRLAAAIAADQRLSPPKKLAPLHRRLLRGLREQLESFRRATRALEAHDAAALKAAEAVGTAGRADVSRALTRLQRAVGACRDDVDKC